MRYLRHVIAAVFGTAVLFSGTSVQAAPLFDFTCIEANVCSLADPTEMFLPTPFPGFPPPGFSDTLGYTFSVSGNITVNGIGIFDEGGDGLGSVHNVALWDSSVPSTALITSSVGPFSSPANSDPSDSGAGRFIYTTIADFILDPGEYTIGASYGPGNSNKDMVVSGPDTIVLNDPGNSMFGVGAFGLGMGSGIVFPAPPTGGKIYFGPALRIAATIPEPMTFALLMIGLAGMSFKSRKLA